MAMRRLMKQWARVVGIVGMMLVSVNAWEGDKEEQGVSQWYVGGAGAMGFERDLRVVKGALADEMETKLGFGANVMFGYIFENVWKIEGNIVYQKFNAERMWDPMEKGALGSNFSTTALMVNGLYEVVRMNDFHIGLGGGIGAARIRYSDKVNPTLSCRKWVLGVNFIGEFGYMINEQWSLLGRYRMLVTGKASTFKRMPIMNTVEVGVQYKF